MPFKSKAQSRWANSPAGLRALGGADNVKEWDDFTDFSTLPEKAEGGAISRALKSRRPTNGKSGGVLSKRFQSK